MVKAVNMDESPNTLGNPPTNSEPKTVSIANPDDDVEFVVETGNDDLQLNAVSDKYVNNSTQAIYKKYQRFGRKDVISRIKLSHALESEYFNKPPMIWKKSHDGSSN